MATTKTNTTKTATKATTKKAEPKATATKRYDFMGFPGLAMTSLNRATGSQVSIWFNAQGGPMKGNAKPWSIECETHGTKKATDTRTEARDFRLDPTTFCAKCAAAAKKGGAVKDVPAKKAAGTKAPAKVASKKATGSKKAAA